MTARIWLFRGRGLASTLIRWQTRGPWSHAAVELDGDVYEAREFRTVAKRPWTVVLDEARQNRVRVATIAMPITRTERIDMRAFLEAQVGKRYDWSSVFRFVSRRQVRRERAHVWFCSELVFAAFRHADIDLLARTQPWEVSPQLLARTPLAGELRYFDTPT